MQNTGITNIARINEGSRRKTIMTGITRKEIKQKYKNYKKNKRKGETGYVK